MSQSILNAEVQIPELLKKWEQLHADIKVLFEKRDSKNVRVPMEAGIQLLIEFIYLTNDLSLEKASDIAISSLSYKPVNIDERLQFLKLRPNIFPSFVQLNELFEEQKKLYAKKTAIGNAGIIN